MIINDAGKRTIALRAAPMTKNHMYENNNNHRIIN